MELRQLLQNGLMFLETENTKYLIFSENRFEVLKNILSICCKTVSLIVIFIADNCGRNPCVRGHPNPNDCSQCVCPDGFAGSTCADLAPSTG